VQPSGPYRIGGFCTAGLVAFEIARQLEAAGERVERLVLIDTTGINVRFRPLEPVLRVLARGATEDARLERRAALLRELRYYSGRWRQVRRMSRMDQLRWFGINLRRRLPLLRASAAAAAAAAAAEEAGPGFAEPPQTSAEFLARPGTRVLRFQERAGVAYVPKAYSGAIDLIWASDSFPRSAPDQTNGWSRVSPAVRTRTVDSVHVGLITYNLPALAAEIRACLNSDAPVTGGG
jgi:thioesterase domain-containing protein